MMASIFISLVTNNGEHLPVRLLTICTTSLKNLCALGMNDEPRFLAQENFLD